MEKSVILNSQHGGIFALNSSVDYCFTGDMSVILADGCSRKKIESLEVNDELLAYNMHMKISTSTKVSALIYKLIYGFFQINNTLCVTSNHPIATQRGWVMAKVLQIGDAMIDQRGAYCEISNKKYIEEIALVYTIEVAPIDNYFVEGFLVATKSVKSMSRFLYESYL